MGKLTSTSYTTGAFNAGTLFLRLGLGGLLMKHGYDKLVHFAQYKTQFINFLGIGQSTSLALVIFAEFFCALFILIGLFTRLAAIPIIIVMCVALFKAHNGQVLGEGEMAALYLSGYIALLFIGPGKISVDGMMGK
ncbi:MAG: DoxX family protein [Ferruginibacter sp.]